MNNEHKITQRMTLEFDLSDPEAKRAAELSLKAPNLLICLQEVWPRLFRPAQKGGYPSGELSALLNEDTLPRAELEARLKLISLLNDEFNAISSEWQLDLLL